jgi:hypothetical protein
MHVDQLDTNLRDLTHSEVMLTVGNTTDFLIDHYFFKDNWPTYLTHPTQLKEDLRAYHGVVQAVQTDGGKKNQKEREERFNNIQVTFDLFGQYVVMRSISENKPSFLEEIPLKLKTRLSRGPSKTVQLAAPIVALKHGQPKSILVSYNKVSGAGSNEIQICTGAPNDEASWRTVGTYSQCRVEVPGLEPGSRVHVRVRCHGTGTPGPWSEVVSIIVL